MTLRENTSEDAILAALRDNDEPLPMNEIGLAVGTAGHTGHWTPSGWRSTYACLLALRNRGLVVKLPHEGTRCGATYTDCDDHDQATSMQLATTEALLADLPESMHRTTLKGRLLLQALVGLRAM